MFPFSCRTQDPDCWLAIGWRPLLDPRSSPPFPEALFHGLLYHLIVPQAYKKSFSLQSAKMNSDIMYGNYGSYFSKPLTPSID